MIARRLLLLVVTLLAIAVPAHPAQADRISISELPLPPAAPSAAIGSCTTAINPHGTGCLGTIEGPGKLPDTRFVVVDVTFAGAPVGSVYTGAQTILIRTDGRRFPSGDPWKCLTCGTPDSHKAGLNPDISTYPDGFPDGKRILIGANILDCAPYRVTDPACTPDKVHIYPIRWNTTADGSGPGGGIRELRLNPDGVHLGWNHFVLTGTQYDEFGFMGRLVFDPAPTTGTPLTARYDLAAVTELFNPAPRYQPYVAKPGNRLVYNPAGMIGEFRGWSSDGRSALGIQSYESDSVDAFETSNATGRSRPLTRHAEYVDPIRMSPDGRWTLAEELAGTGRMDFMSAMEGIPPITDQLPTTAHVSGLHDNGDRRFFLPYLVSTRTGRGVRLDYDGDPNWNARADPSWLADGSGVVWSETMVTAPACGGTNPLPCPVSHEPGGRTSRLLIARFPGRHSVHQVAPVPDTVAWGTPYTPGATLPVRPHLPAGTYTVSGKVRGSASVVITENPRKIQVAYRNYSDDGSHIINGTESAASVGPPYASTVTLHENLTLGGRRTGTKTTSEPGGLQMLPQVLASDWEATGTLTTTIDGRSYSQPANGT